jgi:hypothetical protein
VGGGTWLLTSARGTGDGIHGNIVFQESRCV